nr:hypothetical protein CFP56_34791 [Quercus suber]
MSTLRTQNSIRAVEQAMDRSETKERAPKGVRQTDGQSVDAAMQDLQRNMINLRTSPMNVREAPGYGALPPDAIQPLRALHATVTRILGTSPETDTPAVHRKRVLELQQKLAAFARVIDPNHPLAMLAEAEQKATTKDDEQDGE